jgi:hypothetical protein
MQPNNNVNVHPNDNNNHDHNHDHNNNNKAMGPSSAAAEPVVSLNLNYLLGVAEAAEIGEHSRVEDDLSGRGGQR